MRERERLDKILVHMGTGSRSEIRRMARAGEIFVNGSPVKDASIKIDPVHDEIVVRGERIVFREFIYIMMNKPAGVISATEDGKEKTVVDLLDRSLQHFRPFPVGRLDKDTTGLMLLTNDGKLAHQLLSPKHNVAKTYEAVVTGKVTEQDIRRFEEGVTLKDGYTTRPAKLEVMAADDDKERSLVHVTITEGKYHQIKRMFASIGKKVLSLKRLTLGPLRLDPALKEGEYRELTKAETEMLRRL